MSRFDAAGKHAGISSSPLASALRRFETLGFIEKTRQGGIVKDGKVCSLYRFTDEPTLNVAKAGVKACPPTCDWKKISLMAEAKGALRSESSEITSKVRPSKRSASTIEAENSFAASTLEHVANSPLRPSNRSNEPAIAPEPA